MFDQLNIAKNLYSKFKQKHSVAREYFAKPLTFTQKILASHLLELCDENKKPIVPGNSYAYFYPDRVAMQDATAQMALLQFISAQKEQVAIPTTLHCDHLIQARVGVDKDLNNALVTNQEVYDFLQSASQKYGIGFFKPGSGIIHQVVLENYAFPGGMMIGTDSHTPNAGGLGMVAIGVGGADAVDVMLGGPLLLKWPKVIGVKLTGNLKEWSSPKDIILKLMEILTVKGGTGHIVEFFGDGCESISATAKATITNMGAEHGATCSVFPYDSSMYKYLVATDRKELATLAQQYEEYLKADAEVYVDPHEYYDQVIEINLSELAPQIVGPHSPDLCRTLTNFKKEIIEKKYPINITAALIGSCTNSSYEDISRASSIAKEALNLGLSAKVPFYITPGSDTVFKTVTNDGLLEPLEKIGGVILANACGPCIGQWQRDDIKKGEQNTIVSSYNRNFPGRNDGNSETLSFLTSPEVVVAMALSGKLDFDPQNDFILHNDKKIKLSIPQGKSLPKQGMQLSNQGYIAPSITKSSIQIKINPNSDRLALLKPFLPWDGNDFIDLAILLKAKGKCTTDHISQAGIWLKYRGHLDKIANNTYIGAINAFSDKPGYTIDLLDNNKPILIPELARKYMNNNISWIVIGDENFGEGSSREHAAMQPRYLGCKAIIVRSFARIHESNLKKHGILPLTFFNPKDYDKIQVDDKISIVNLHQLAENLPVKVVIKHKNNNTESIVCNHSLSEAQINWFKAGSALNALAQEV